MTGVAFSRSAARAVPGRRAHHHRRVDVRTKVGSWPFALPAKEQPATSFAKGITYISYEGNSFYVKFNATGARVLVDPWLVGDLVFGDQDWLYKGKKKQLKGVALDVAKIASETDVVLITQGLDDHCSMPTLEQLPRELPIVAAPEAAARIADLGFASVTTLRHGQAADVCDGRLHVEATPGALVGPPWSRRQNGYVLSENLRGGGTSLYYEPHCDFDRRALKSLGQVDIVVSPITSTLIKVPSLGLDYPLVSGDINLMELLTGLAPRVLIPLLNNEIEQEGDLTKYLTESGAGPDELRAALAERRILTRVEMPAPPGEALAIAL